jgi:adenosylcobinamide kinase/adenosylcobinamide-phosphate guanylyltransferase
VLGGARSGKSSFAEEIVTKLGGLDVIYLATSEVRDQEMAQRIKHHQSSRPSEWATIEEPKNIGEVLADLKQGAVVLLDCLTLLISNLLLAEQDLKEKEYDFRGAEKEEEIITEVERIITVVKERGLTLVVVSNEVGQGLVPAYKLGRVYRDIVGRANQLVASQADGVYITYAGIPVEIKELGMKIKRQFTMDN